MLSHLWQFHNLMVSPKPGSEKQCWGLMLISDSELLQEIDLKNYTKITLILYYNNRIHSEESVTY